MIKNKKTNQPFYGLYEYSFRFRVTEVASFQSFQGNAPIQRDDLIVSITNKYLSRRNRINTWYMNHSISPGRITASSNEIRDREINDLIKLLDILYPYRSSIKLNLSGDYAYLFTNDINLIKRINNEPYVRYGKITRANVVCEPNSIAIRNNSYLYRSYIQELRLEKSEKVTIKNVLDNQENIKLSDSFNRWLTTDWKWSRRYFFIDHNDDKLQLLLGLVNPKLIRKTLSIINN